MIFRLKKRLFTRFPTGKILFSTIVGLLIATYFAQQQQTFKEIVKRATIAKFEEILGCSLNYEIDNLNLFYPTIIIKNIVVKPKTKRSQSWNWKCDQITVKFSWLNYLLLGTIDSHIYIKQIKLNSLYANNNLAIAPHLYCLLVEPSDIPVEIKEINISSGVLNTYNKDESIKSQLCWSSKTKELRNTLKSNIYIKNGSIKKGLNTYLDKLCGSMQISIPTDGDLQKIAGTKNISFITPHINPGEKYFMSAKWANGFGMYKLNSINGTIDLSPVSINLKNNELTVNSKGYFSLAIAQKFMPTKLLQTLDGNCLVRTKLKLNSTECSLSGNCDIENLTIDSNLIVDIAKLSFKRKSKTWNGQLKVVKEKKVNINGAWKWDEEIHNGYLSFKNSNNIDLPFGRGWQIKPNNLFAKININKSKDFLVSGKYKAICNNNKLDTEKNISGSIKYNNNNGVISGKIDQNKYLAIVTPKSPYIKKIYLESQDKQKVFLIKENNKNKSIKSILDIELINKWLPNNIQNIISGQGKLEINSQINNNILSNKFKLINNNLVIPRIYNLIKKLDGNANLNLKTNQLKISNTNLEMHKGKLEIPKATISPYFIYLPVLFKNCAINFEKNLITNISGKILYQNQDSKTSTLKGLIILEQTLCKYNLLSEEIRNLFSTNSIPHSTTEANPNININIITRTPIKIRSQSLETNANVNINITNNLNNPLFLGYINIVGGKINFPSKALQITSGSLYFTPEQPNQPMIDLVAKNQIKRYSITMHISGSINNPYIILESSPSLTEEQIGALLLTGSENTTLNMIMPAIIMQNLNSIIFGSIYDNENNSNLKNLLKPLDHIKFIPSFSDETGRGGLKGAVEIDVNDRLRALIQKNFSLSEDTKIEIDYALTDDVSIRGIKDERGDLGGEIEIRWRI